MKEIVVMKKKREKTKLDQKNFLQLVDDIHLRNHIMGRI